ncbi:7583_t:CDS:2 [Scutellospora calospora]|uniref:7583_t:CDS:1 n=1 Tax=Scutellospora calospora TaxID=85575 RepID=A0ACA9KL44_9GLOM|nr:7583_t:CDS:2 [Scutellospora calospora]
MDFIMDSSLETLSRLSLDLLDFLQKNGHERLSLIVDSFPEYYSRTEYDVTIRVGQAPNIEDFYCNSDVLIEQSKYFRTALSHNYITKDGNSILLEEPTIIPSTFRILLRLLYKRDFDLSTLDGTLFINLIKVAEHFGLNDIRNELQRNIIESNSTWLQENLVKILNSIFIDDSGETSETIQNHLISKICSNPSYLLNSNDFGELKESCLAMLLSDIGFFMNQGIAWDIIISWGTRQNQALKRDIPLWSFQDWTLLKDAVKNVIIYINYDRISRNDFYGKIIPFSRIIPQNLDSRALQHYLDKDVKSKYNDIFRRVYLDDSTLINHYHSDFILKWIDNRQKLVSIKKRKTLNRIFSFRKYKRNKSIKQKAISRKFVLLYRITSQDKDTKISIKDYKDLCINRPNTLVVAKVQGSNTIIGGFAPNGLDLDFLSSGTPTIDKSFLFLFKNGAPNFNDSIVSRMHNVHNFDNLNNSYLSVGPRFGIKDLVIDLYKMKCTCQPEYYDYIISDKEFNIEECEIFQINHC